VPRQALAALTLGLSLVVFTAGAAPEPPDSVAAARRYRWTRRHPRYLPLVQRFPSPPGFERLPAARGSYADWLRHLPLLPERTPVRSFRGAVILPAGHAALAAVVDLDVGKRDRQQCADTIMRLRGEYLFASGQANQTRFPWAGGKRFGFDDWRRGLRPVHQGRRWTFEPRARPGEGYASFRAYLEFMFSWTGTIHLVGEAPVRAATIQAGDFFIQGGSPGHAVIVLDLARGPDGKLRALIGQGFMPAQDLHLLRGADGSPWFGLDPSRSVATPLWRPFRWSDLRRARN
jgi:hypothetical protein